MKKNQTPLGRAIDAGRAAIAALDELSAAEARTRQSTAMVCPDEARDVVALPTIIRLKNLGDVRARTGKAIVDFAEAVVPLGVGEWCEALATLARVHLGLTGGLRLTHDEARVGPIILALESWGETEAEEAAPLSAHAHTRDTETPPAPEPQA